MYNFSLRFLKRILRIVGLAVNRAPYGITIKIFLPRFPKAKLSNVKIHIGSGTLGRDGYINCDIRPLPGVKIVCPAWELSMHANEVSAIYSRHMLEHLTFAEVDATLADWYRALALGGTIEVWVPNMTFHIEQWQRAEWNHTQWKENKSDARWGAAGFYGWQRECDPRQPDYSSSYWDCHKSGFDTYNARFFLNKHGFVDVTLKVVDEIHLVMTARKATEQGERQVASIIEQVRPDHRGRYYFAANHLSTARTVLDLACGVGYGSRILADAIQNVSVTGIDRDKGAVQFALTHYANDRIRFLHEDVTTFEHNGHIYDAAVSFETIEHLAKPELMLQRIRKHLGTNSTFICSTPNQETMPFNPEQFIYHVRHYTPKQLRTLLTDTGFRVLNMVSQHDKQSEDVSDNSDGLFLIAICECT
ncbi:methyltransferase domain-containing protein [Calycomorphotria hydatis]|uniref:Putative S-adenosylmethionine-dependent methyltransferase/MSMEI_2290 n=1 Tax=Calycomorphotria hydatis TaxID=2528027 RepID=A0A517TED3_9PLAN|nr:methyltransferase domain-containing protein [Calycomorphotria hydatis]QDT66734.1 putative S-adenosylmethionine-dependent methyltransferase/MSMEI_2290 [Calycomorphotria hydatis]